MASGLGSLLMALDKSLQGKKQHFAVPSHVAEAPYSDSVPQAIGLQELARLCHLERCTRCAGCRVPFEAVLGRRKLLRNCVRPVSGPSVLP